MQLLLFSKMFQSLPLEKFAELTKEMGFDGVDLTVRSNGYIKPYEVKEKLPEAVEIIKSRGISVPMITTEITNAQDIYTKDIFKTASELGIRYLKLGYWKYKGFGFLRKQIEEIREALKEIQELCKEYNITSAIHIHSGMFITAEPTIVWIILEGFDPDYIGAYIDPGHMVLEGGLAGWIMGLDLLKEKIRIVAIKDYAWFKVGEKWEAHTVPIGHGMVPWKKFFEILKDIGFNGPISVHSEYNESLHPELYSLEKIVEQTKEDLKYIKTFI